MIGVEMGNDQPTQAFRSQTGLPNPQEGSIPTVNQEKPMLSLNGQIRVGVFLIRNRRCSSQRHQSSQRFLSSIDPQDNRRRHVDFDDGCERQ